MPQSDYTPYAPAAAYFDLVRQALGEAVDGAHFFDIIAPDIAYEVLYDFPGWPRRMQGRPALMAAFRGYVEHIALASTSNLVVHKADDGRIYGCPHSCKVFLILSGKIRGCGHLFGLSRRSAPLRRP